MRFNSHLTFIILAIGATPSLGGTIDRPFVEMSDFLADGGYDYKESQAGQMKVKAVAMQNQIENPVKVVKTLSEMQYDLKRWTDARQALDGELYDLHSKNGMNGLHDEIIKKREALAVASEKGLNTREILTLRAELAERVDTYNFRVYTLSQDITNQRYEFVDFNNKIVAERLAIKEAGGVLGEEAILKNYRMQSRALQIELPPKPYGLKLAAVLFVLFLIGSLPFIAMAYDTPAASHSQDQSQMQAAIVKGASTPAALTKEGCTQLQSAAARVEGIATGEASVKQYYSLMEALKPVYHEAYQVASRSVAENLAEQPITSWGNATAAPFIPVIPVGATDGEKTKLKLEFAAAHKNWTVNEHMRPVQSQFQFAQKYHEDIHAAAFVHMRDSPALSFATNSSHFKQAYTGMYARYNILPECSPYVHEDKVTTAWFKEGRAMHAVLLANSTAALDIHFAARSAVTNKISPPLLLQL